MRLFWLLLYSITVASANTTAVSEPNFNRNYRSVRAHVGESVQLDCTPSGLEVGVAWLFNNSPLQESSEVYYVNQVLNITIMREEYQGWYTCTARTRDWDQLLIAVDAEFNRELISIPQEFEYTVLEGSQVELPCITPRIPIWRYNGSEVGTGMRYTVVNLTGSLIIHNVTLNDFSGSFQCDDNPNSTYSVSVIKLNGTAGMATSALHLQIEDDYIIRSRTLSCANISNEENQDFVIRWTKNLKDITSSFENNTNKNSIRVTSSGFYCCQLQSDYGGRYYSTYCATVLISDVVLPSSVSLPTNRGRDISLLCHTFPDSSVYDQYLLSLSGNIIQDAICNESANSVSYQTHANNPMTMSLVNCSGESIGNIFESQSEASIVIQVVELPGGSNLLEGYTGDFSNSSHFDSVWNPQDGGYGTINGETVLYVNVSFGKGKLCQHIRLDPFSSSVSVSGRMRQEFTTGVATIEILSRSGAFPFSNPFPDSRAWQWVSGMAKLCTGIGYWECIIGVNVMIQLTVTEINSTLNGVAYFDNLELSTSLDIWLVIVVTAIATVLLVLLLLICSLFIIVCHSCIRRTRRKVTVTDSRNAGLVDKNLQYELKTALTKYKRDGDVQMVRTISDEELCALPGSLNEETGPSSNKIKVNSLTCAPGSDSSRTQTQSLPVSPQDKDQFPSLRVSGEGITTNRLENSREDLNLEMAMVRSQNSDSKDLHAAEKKLDLATTKQVGNQPVSVALKVYSDGPTKETDSEMPSFDPDYEYFIAGDQVTLEIKDINGSDNARGRSDSLTSEGYVDVALLGIHKAHQELELNSSTRGAQEAKRRSLSETKSSKNIESSVKERSGSLTSQGYVDVASLGVVGKQHQSEDGSINKPSAMVKDSNSRIESTDGKESGDTERSRERSDSLTSQGYVDVESLGIHKPSPKPSSSHGEESDTAHSYLGIVGSPSSLVTSDEDAIYDEPSPIPRDNALGVNAFSSNVSSSQKDVPIFMYQNLCSIATDGIPTSSIKLNEERLSDHRSTGLAPYPRKKAHSVNLPAFSDVTRPKCAAKSSYTALNNPAKHSKAKSRNTFMGLSHLEDTIYDEPNQLTNDGYVDVNNRSSPNNRSSSVGTQQEGQKADVNGKKQMQRSDSLTSQGYVDVQTETSHLDSDEEYCYINPKELSM